jgi:hypothetical protein
MAQPKVRRVRRHRAAEAWVAPPTAGQRFGVVSATPTKRHLASRSISADPEPRPTKLFRLILSAQKLHHQDLIEVAALVFQGFFFEAVFDETHSFIKPSCPRITDHNR